ncbi:KTSC domain-containing protein [Vallitalea guaymasensis]|uniref:KTSC domain-containing protein n=1 Tax=Vallitalea guaymasensis TaxID=1185412 RepID=UPI000DE379A1|nr:KTSC domain-containing protein [Vallitalea guaymasensis]
MNRQYVSSSDICSIGYSSGTLEIEFHSGSIYQYSNVPEHIFAGLMNASSKGSYFHSYVKNTYTYIRIR